MLATAFGLYLLADRYLIEHVEGKAILTAESAVTETPSNVESDDWNYKSDNVTINIEKVQTGQGKDMVTYFVADVQMSDASSLKSAFAKNIFGRNVVEKTSQIAADNQAIFAVNGDYYGFRSDGVLIRNGVLYRDEPARVGAALFEDGTMQTFDETEVASSSLLAAGALHTLSFGPVLIKNSEIVEDFEKVSIDSNFGNRSIQGSNPRTGIGMISANHYVFVVVDGRKENYSKGMTLSEFTDVFADLGCTEAYNLDGGGSSTMYFMGRVVNNPLGKQDERSISDILYIEG
ncbi:phosphodiester glycosidase family protein [Desulfosporosinus sp.]|uniref:phosphodiester glycosidase family protein n=1 Tax=Desulfosporosinus sp. TaxID=157907 RepID=UPI002636D57D|nr:phosphodiester glycosidase family protein [Desulfosporosinus sp.]